MLKRFMTWLLNQLQKALSAFGSKRNGARADVLNRESKGAFDLRTKLKSDKKIEPSDITVAERSPYIPSPESSSSDANSTSLSTAGDDVAISDTNIAEASSQETDTQGTDTIDIRQHLDVTAAAASVPEIVDKRVGFPTEVSELLSSPPDLESATDIYARPIKRFPDEQLPAIQDLLPAITSSELPFSDAESKTYSDSEIDNDSEPKGLMLDGSGLDGSGLDESAELENASSVQGDEQAVLFSFDIVERDNENKRSARRIFSDSPTNKANSLISDKSGSDDVDTEETADPSRQTIIEQPEENSPISEVDGKSKENGISLEAESVDPLPYPWSTATSNPTESVDEENVEVLTNSTSILSKSIADDELTGSATSLTAESNFQPDTGTIDALPGEAQHPTKSGTIKLLFTLKQGNFHGYIAPDDGSKDILFHQKYINAGIFPKLERGAQVLATVKYIEGKAYATHVDLL